MFDFQYRGLAFRREKTVEEKEGVDFQLGDLISGVVIGIGVKGG